MEFAKASEFPLGCSAAVQSAQARRGKPVRRVAYLSRVASRGRREEGSRARASAIRDLWTFLIACGMDRSSLWLLLLLSSSTHASLFMLTRWKLSTCSFWSMILRWLLPERRAQECLSCFIDWILMPKLKIALFFYVIFQHFTHCRVHSEDKFDRIDYSRV